MSLVRLLLSLAVLVLCRNALAEEHAPSFRNQVQPILAAAGCSSGACHGAAAGKNGFKLSLRGYDDDGDWRSITRHSLGRRITPADPAHSLLLLKATNAIPHKGGERIKVGSPEYTILAEWIAWGAPGPQLNDPRIERLELQPPAMSAKPGDQAQIHVLAHFSDGSKQDVTRWAKYTASESSVAIVDETGKIKVNGAGEGAITAWYLSRIAIATVTVPFANDVSSDAYSKQSPHNFIDKLVTKKLQALRLPPSPLCSDEEFLRRAFIDTIGVLPSADEARAFLNDKSTDKRDRLIDSLLSRREFVDYWTYKWSDLLLVSSRKLKPAANRAYYNWIREQVAANTPWDELARRVVTATGSTLENGAGNFFVLHDDPTLMAETASQAFLGMSVQCAKCHNHPMEKWTNDQYYGFANLFSRVRVKNGGREGDFVVFASPEGELIQPLTGKPRPPQPLDGTAIATDAPQDRRLALADWLVSRQNPYFSRAIANRVWANFMGVGLVEAVDDMRKTNPPSHAELLDALAEYLADQKFNLKPLMREILRSQTYQRSSETVAGNAGDHRYYSHCYPRRLMAEVMLDALSQVTAAPTAFKDYPAGTRALQLPDSNIDSYFLKAFGRADRMLTCECERTAMPSMAQALHIANGDTINAKLTAKGSRIEKLLAGQTPDEKIIEEAYLSALSRYPTADEKKQFVATLAEAAQAGPQARREAVEDLFWSVLSSKAFLFNH